MDHLESGAYGKRGSAESLARVCSRGTAASNPGRGSNVVRNPAHATAENCARPGVGHQMDADSQRQHSRRRNLNMGGLT